MEKDLATIQEISNFAGNLIREANINPLHGLTLMAIALRESTVNVCNTFNIPPATGLAFVGNYVLVGTQGEQKKYIGNAVEVNQSRVLCEALAEKLEEFA